MYCCWRQGRWRRRKSDILTPLGLAWNVPPLSAYHTRHSFLIAFARSFLFCFSCDAHQYQLWSHPPMLMLLLLLGPIALFARGRRLHLEFRHYEEPLRRDQLVVIYYVLAERQQARILYYILSMMYVHIQTYPNISRIQYEHMNHVIYEHANPFSYLNDRISCVKAMRTVYVHVASTKYRKNQHDNSIIKRQSSQSTVKDIAESAKRKWFTLIVAIKFNIMDKGIQYEFYFENVSTIYKYIHKCIVAQPNCGMNFCQNKVFIRWFVKSFEHVNHVHHISCAWNMQNGITYDVCWTTQQKRKHITKIEPLKCISGLNKSDCNVISI